MKVFIRRSTNNRSIIRTSTRSFLVCEFTSCIFVGPISKGTSPHFSKLDIHYALMFLFVKQIVSSTVICLLPEPAMNGSSREDHHLQVQLLHREQSVILQQGRMMLP